MSGDEEAIQTIVRSHQRPVFLLALTILDDGRGDAPGEAVIAQAEAVAQQAFMNALDHLNRYREDIPFDIWLYRYTLKAARSHNRRARLLSLPARLLSPARRTAADERVGQASSSADAEGASLNVGRASLPASSPPVSSPPAPHGEPASSTSAAADARPAASDAPLSDDDLWQTVRRLNDSLRIPVVLRYYHDLSIEQIAQVLRLSPGAVHARLDAARERIASQEGKSVNR